MNFRPQKIFLPIAIGAASFLIGTGCERDDVKVYHVETQDASTSSPAAMAPSAGAAPNAAPSSGMMPSGMPSTMPTGLPTPDNSNLPKLTYTVPAGWTEKAPSQMRVASFEASDDGKSVDISVVPLGGMGGGDFANVNRWRGQVGLSPATDGEISQSATQVTIAGTPASVYDINGTANGAPTRIIGAILPRDEAVWFFKMMGDSDATEKQKAAFIQFLGTVQFGTGAASTAPTAMMAGSQLPPGHPAIGDTGMGQVPAAADVSTGPKPVWTVPVGWQGGTASTFLVAKYIVSGDNGAQADINISSLASNANELLPNINRWRGQLGLAPLGDLVPDSFGVPDGKAYIVDFTGTDARSGKPARLVGVIAPRGSQTWFYKLMGDPDLVAQQKDAFKQFIQSAKYPDAQ